jgi:hypothetical protein
MSGENDLVELKVEVDRFPLPSESLGVGGEFFRSGRRPELEEEVVRIEEEEGPWEGAQYKTPVASSNTKPIVRITVKIRKTQ